ncbi:hypothetical protein DVH24_003104 [Malus domestica]|uniref:Uncharacterized protein n=1 Tax=Malus domestica TaxID=3750 RepID=A0A498K6L0_MALDO|nr:hypothetical protein DVH24_003104 [Malus domestica]
MGLLLGLGIAGSLILFAGLGLVWFIYRKKSKAVDGLDENLFCNKLIDKELENVTGPRKFSYHELAQATSNLRRERSWEREDLEGFTEAS